VLPAGLLQVGVAQVRHAAAQGGQQGLQARLQGGQHPIILHAFDLLQQALEIDADELKFRHPLHRVDVHLHQLVQR
jgi:hypothetical protein